MTGKMTEVNGFQDVAAIMIAAGKRAGLITGALGIVPELSEVERKFFIALISEVKQEELAELTQDEISCLFNFVTAKACEVISCWHADQVIDFGFEDIFSDEVPLTGDKDVIEEIRRSEVSRLMSDAFFQWMSEDPEAMEHDPILPLMEALKWDWRITINVALDILGK